MESSQSAPILNELERLSRAYPERRPPRETLMLYVENLVDVPVWLLHRAVEQHINRSPWFPKISDLRSLCAEIARTPHFESLPRTPQDPLAQHALRLEERFYHAALLDEREWASLAESFEAAGRPERAAHTRAKLRQLCLVRDGTAQDSWMSSNEELLRMLGQMNIGVQLN